MNLISDLQIKFEELCCDMPGFDNSKDSKGDYLETGTQTAWEGFQQAEEWKNTKTEKVLLSKCPEPLDGWCDCIKCKAMQFHKVKKIYVCLFCHKKTEPNSRINYNSADWLPDIEYFD